MIIVFHVNLSEPINIGIQQKKLWHSAITTFKKSQQHSSKFYFEEEKKVLTMLKHVSLTRKANLKSWR